MYRDTITNSNKHMKSLFFFLLLFPLSLLVSQNPKYEVRAAWISTASGDWPKTLYMEEQQRSLVDMFDLLQRNNFNTVYFQVRPRGNTFYKSDIEPWAQQLTGTLGEDPGWDPLAFAIDEAHKRGMELHAWFNVAKVWGASDLPANPRHITKKHPDWIQHSDGEWWIDMGIPEARAYTEDLVMELVKNYDIDGIQFDFIRYPSGPFNDTKSYAKWGNGQDLQSWRRGNITAFVRDCYTEIQQLKPWCKVGSSPLGIYNSIDGAASEFAGYTAVAQESRAWLRQGITDYLVPQIYWSLGEQDNPYDPDFEILCKDWAGENYGREVIAGLGIYKDNIQPEVQQQVIVSRDSRLQGEAFFRFDNISGILDQLGSVYRSMALFPPMIWKDSIPPLAPEHITVQSKENASTAIQWNDPKPASDGQLPYWYVVYSSSSQPVDTRKAENIAAVVPATVHSIEDDQSAAGGKQVYYTVTSLDRSGNESVLPSEPAGETPSIFTRYMRPASAPTLSANYPEPFSGRTYITYDLPVKSTVTITLTYLPTQKDTVIVNEVKDPGLHIVAIDGSMYPAGEIECRLQADGTVLRRVMQKK